MRTTPIYLDYAAATPLDERVFAAMQPYLSRRFYNPSSAYQAAREVRTAYEAARAGLASQLGVKPHDIILTAGATESANLALQGVMKSYPGSAMAVSAIEHQAVLVLTEHYPHQLIQPDRYGIITEEALAAAIDDATVVVSIGMINSEIGTRQPIKKLARTIQGTRDDRRRRGIDLPLYFHTDASQAAGVEDLHVNRLGVDMMTLGASKLHGPKQTGLLYAHHAIMLQPLVYGGGQERGLRSGTENTAGAIGFAKALELAQTERRERTAHLVKLKDRFIKLIADELPEAIITIPPEKSAPHIVHLSFDGIDAERLLFLLDERGVMVATGAACAANKHTGSHVLAAIGLDDRAIQGSIRCSFGYGLGYDEIESAARIIAACVQEIKQSNITT